MTKKRPMTRKQRLTIIAAALPRMEIARLAGRSRGALDDPGRMRDFDMRRLLSDIIGESFTDIALALDDLIDAPDMLPADRAKFVLERITYWADITKET